ncbi:O-antigen ligase family protein [Rhizobium sp. AQ_MP]|uniref:O-antigen ligase family protein n=1 Tax=Rhizobium sp. AQ_MP TaxID=2761536 RepID=UPI00163A1BC5|nr:O-antigen ligase family protein [Rhizobium sp. AQ_MP]MBC2775890.1 O-antigen ligase family protein [Rhizobium sp. AQ_MP]
MRNTLVSNAAPRKGKISWNSFLLFVILFFWGYSIPTPFDSETRAASDVGDPLFRPLLLFILGTVFLLIVFRLSLLLQGAKKAALWLLLGAWALLSTGWSVSPGDTWIAAINMLAVILVTSYLATVLDYQKTSDVVCVALIGLCVVSILMGLFQPQYGTMTSSKFAGLLRGIYSHKNILAANVLVLLTWTLAAAGSGYLKGRLVPFAISLGFFTIAWAGSSTAIAATAIAVSLVVAIKFALKARLSFSAMILIISFLVTVGAITLPAALEVILSLFGKDATFSGRDVIWVSYLDLGAQRPGIGYGFNAISKIGVFDSRLFTVDGRAASAHNAFIQMYVSIGAPATIFFILIILSTILRGIGKIKERCCDVYFLIVFPTIFSVYSFMEGSGGFYFSTGLILLIICHTGSACRTRDSIDKRRDPRGTNVKT